jgi:flavin reductase
MSRRNEPADNPSPPKVEGGDAIDAGLFREAMSRLGAAVHVVTTAGAAGTAGLTATAVCSVSDTPATLLVCVNKRSHVTPYLHRNGVFCVNTLAASDEGIAKLFAGRTGLPLERRFSTTEWLTLATGAPALASAVAAFDCRITLMHEVGSHNVIFGAVAAIRLGPAVPALVYHARSYKQV